MKHVRESSLLCLAILSAGSEVAAAPVCTPTGEGQLRCTITRASDCDAINPYPYAKNLFCPAAFQAVQEMLGQVSRTLDTSGPTGGFFYFYQTLPDPYAPPDQQAQTTIDCLATPAPFPGGSFFVEGAGNPLCHLVAYATSPGPTAADSSGNPVPTPLHGFPGYFAKLYAPTAGFPLLQFRAGSVFDPIVRSLGAAGADGFLTDYPEFSTDALYDPDRWFRDPHYRGISGGGGGGWGGEIGIAGPRGETLTLLAFGGGGGGGMTSWKKSPSQSITALGAGGGGGMQFGNAYRVKNRNYNGLGLGAGVGSDETAVQYSYNDYEGSGRPQKPVHEYNPAVIDDYQAQLANLAQQLESRFAIGKTIVFQGGGGMGGGTEYLMANGQEYEPHALSTQAGFQFSYEFSTSAGASSGAPSSTVGGVAAELDDLYEVLGDYFHAASDQAFNDCGRDYSNFECMCPREHAIVICLAGDKLGDPDLIPSWLQQQHCGDESASHPDPGFTSYQRLLLANSPCTQMTRQYFRRLNTPAKSGY